MEYKQKNCASDIHRRRIVDVGSRSGGGLPLFLPESERIVVVHNRLGIFRVLRRSFHPVRDIVDWCLAVVHDWRLFPEDILARLVERASDAGGRGRTVRGVVLLPENGSHPDMGAVRIHYQVRRRTDSSVHGTDGTGFRLLVQRQ